MFFNKVFFKGGTHVPDSKNYTNAFPIEKAKVPDFVYLPLSMHIGAPAKSIVKPGQKVKLGELIAQANGFVSSNIHSSVSGIVLKNERRFLPNGMVSDCIVIKNDHKDTPFENNTESEDTPEGIRKVLLENGIVGMGGATFPTHVKYAPQKPGEEIDTVIINGIECEPFITADHRVMLEQAELLISGTHYFMKASLASRAIIAVESNKPDAIAHLRKMLPKNDNIEIVECPEKYPQGSEKQLVYATTKRTIAERALPSSVGVIVDNVATAVQTAIAMKQNKPCYERIVTVSGNAINKPGNYLVRVGTLYKDLIENTAGGYSGDLARIISGGPMMGFSIDSLDYPILKGTSGLLLFNYESDLSALNPEQTCVRCGHCVDACPMFLEPTTIAKAVKRKAWGESLNAHVMNCIECGVCSYVCPSHIPLTQYMRMAKQFIGTSGRGGHNPYYKL